MSGILKPMVHSNKVIGGASDPVGIDHIASIAKVDAVFVGAGGASEYKIVFNVNSAEVTPGLVEWRFADAATRDTEHTALLGVVSALVSI